MNVIEKIKSGFLFFDGGTGTILQKQGLISGEKPELWNITHPDKITDLSLSYLNAGANVINTNTFGANLLKFPDGGEFSLEEIVSAAVNNAKKAVSLCNDKSDKYIALDIGPLGRLLKPYGDLEFEDAVKIFARTVNAGKNEGVDLVLLETFNDSLETKAAVLAVKENCNLPLFVTNAYDEKSKLLTGASPSAMVSLLEGLRVDALGVNCSFGPDKTSEVVKQLYECASVPIIANPNAGLPTVENGVTRYDVTHCEFALQMKNIALSGARGLGGCCGTTPEYIKALTKTVSDLAPLEIADRNLSVVSSYTHSVYFGKKPVMIGERINPTGKSKLKEAIRSGNMEYILSEALSQTEKGAEVLDVNVGLPDIDEKTVMCGVVKALQEVTDVCLQIDSSNPDVLESAMRCYNGKPMVNSVNGKIESMESVFPLVKKYGGLVVALTLDENGIPDNSADRVKIAEKIYKTAESYGISKKDIIIDTLAMTISSDNNAALVTIDAIREIKSRLGGLCSLGVSNVSFGLPERDVVNSTFLSMALENGLDGAIMNPNSPRMLGAYYSFLALHNMDERSEKYIEKSPDFAVSASEKVLKSNVSDGLSPLSEAIVKGLRENAKSECITYLDNNVSPLEIIDKHIIPALDVVGKGFEKGTMFLPQLIVSSECAKAVFDILNTKLDTANGRKKRGKFVIATVKGDIHDIGKNIVSSLLSNYGFEVTDLGKDVAPERIVKAVKQTGSRIVGLSALMTTTVPSMESTIKLLKEQCPECKIVVGGAVMTQSYADMIGADKYAKNAMETVRYAESMEDNI